MQASSFCRLALAAWLGLAAPAQAASLAEAFDRAWAARQAVSEARQQLRDSQREASDAWLPGPPALTLSQRSDRLDRNAGLREWEVELSAPLWLWGQRELARRLAEREHDAEQHARALARWQLAGALREAWWEAQLAELDAAAAQQRLHTQRALEADAMRRVNAGQEAPLAHNQAAGARAQAETDWLRAQAQARRALNQFTAAARGAALPQQAEPAHPSALPDAHPLLASLDARVRAAQARLAQANGDSRDAPELALTLTRERGARSEPYQNLAKLSLKIPFGGQARNGPRMAQANVELSEALAELHAGREQLAQDIDSARLARELGQQQARAQAEALQLAEQRLGWIQRAVRAGQLSAPEQWRAQSELHEARSQAQRAQLEAGRAHSRYLQAIGALP